MTIKINRYLWWIFIPLTLFYQPVLSQDTSFRKLSLAYNISIDIPSHWLVLSKDTRKNIAAYAQASIDNAGIEGIIADKTRILAVNSAPNPTGATIRISVSIPPDYDQNDLAATTTTDLKYIRSELFSGFKKLESPGGLKVLEMQSTRIELLNNYRALVFSYIRAGVKGPSPWLVTQYKIPSGNKMIELTLSNRQSNAFLWMPIMERIKRSIRF